MIEVFLTILVASVSLSIHENNSTSKNYGFFQEDYWEQNDIGSMDWNHPLRETDGGGIVDDLNIDRVYEFRNEENSRGRYFPDDKNKTVPPAEEDKKDDKEKPLIAGID